MSLKPKIYKDKLITKYVDIESAALHDNVYLFSPHFLFYSQVSKDRLHKVKAGAGLFNVVDSRPGTSSNNYYSHPPSRAGT
jgi:hypothetical protein